MAVYSIAPFLGPVIGPLAAGFINQVSLVSVRRIDLPRMALRRLRTSRFFLVGGTDYRLPVHAIHEIDADYLLMPDSILTGGGPTMSSQCGCSSSSLLFFS